MILPHDGPLQQRQFLPIVSSLLGTNVPTLSLPSAASIPPLSSIIPIPPLLSGPSSSASSSTSSSSLPSVSSTSATSTVSSTTSSSTTSIHSTVIPSPTASDLRLTTSGGSTITVVVNPTNSPTPIIPSENAFLQNKTASGIVFAIVGIVALVIIIAITTFAIRRRNHNKLVDAISFDPGVINAERGSMEKASIRSSGSDRNVQPYGIQRPYYAPSAIAPNYPRS